MVGFSLFAIYGLPAMTAGMGECTFYHADLLHIIMHKRRGSDHIPTLSYWKGGLIANSAHLGYSLLCVIRARRLEHVTGKAG